MYQIGGRIHSLRRDREGEGPGVPGVDPVICPELPLPYEKECGTLSAKVLLRMLSHSSGRFLCEAGPFCILPRFAIAFSSWAWYSIYEDVASESGINAWCADVTSFICIDNQDNEDCIEKHRSPQMGFLGPNDGADRCFRNIPAKWLKFLGFVVW